MRFSVRFSLRGVPLGVLLALGPICGFGACAPGQRPGPSDSVHDGGPFPGRGPCQGNTTCDRSDPEVVFACEPDGPGVPLNRCETGLTCSQGRCVSPSCALAEMRASITGCLFYTAELDNVDSDDIQSSLIVVTNVGQSLATIRLQARTLGQDWADVQAITVAGGSADSFSVDNPHVEGDGVGAAMARRVVSDAPVTVMLIQSADVDESSNSSAGTMVLPVHALGMHYMAMTYQQVSTPEIDALPGARGGAAEIAIVATQDRTTFRIWPPGVPLVADPQIVSLDSDGDLYQIVSQKNFDDLSGTTIIADKPVALFSGNVTTSYGKSSAGINSPDMAMEQMMPLGAWSKSYVAARLPAQDSACDSILGGRSASLWRFLAARTTVLHFSSSSNGATEMPDMPMTGGVVYSLAVANDRGFVVRADTPFLATQGMDCEPTLSSAVPADTAGALVQLFALPPNFDHRLAIVRRNDGSGFAGPVTLDGNDITGQFVPVGDVFEVAQIGIPPCFGPVPRCIHRLTGAFGLTLRGMDVICGYAVTVPTWTQCTDTCY